MAIYDSIHGDPWMLMDIHGYTWISMDRPDDPNWLWLRLQPIRDSIISATVPLGTSGRVWSTSSVSWFSDVLMFSWICFVFWCSDVFFCCSLRGPQSDHGFRCVNRAPLFTPFFCFFVGPPFWQRLNPKALKMRVPKQLKIIKKCKKMSSKRTHNQDL